MKLTTFNNDVCRRTQVTKYAWR